MSEIRLLHEQDIPGDLLHHGMPEFEVLEQLGRLSVTQPDCSLAEFLLERPATAVSWLSITRETELIELPTGSRRMTLQPQLLGANYHAAGESWDHLLMVQDAEMREGPWVLFDPPGANNRSFHWEGAASYLLAPENAQFSPMPHTPVEQWYYIGRPGRIFSDFRRAGYAFLDHSLSPSYYNNLLRAHQTTMQ